MMWTPDGEGRVNTVSASSGQNPVSGTTYNAAGLPTAINLGSGSGDADAYQWDPNTNRMTQYTYAEASENQQMVAWIGPMCSPSNSWEAAHNWSSRTTPKPEWRNHAATSRT